MSRFVLLFVAVAVAISSACWLPTQAIAIELELGAEAIQVQESKENEGAETTMPFVALGLGLSERTSLFAEFGYLQYTVDKTGDRTGKETSLGVIDIRARSLAAIVARRFGPVTGRLGAGIVDYEFENRLDSKVKKEAMLVGASKLSEKLADTRGRQVLLGFDWRPANWLRTGLEFRHVYVSPKVTAKYKDFDGLNHANHSTADLSHTWFAVRLAFAY